eukprot:366223-Chlamydomonas_euryale.AAC.2
MPNHTHHGHAYQLQPLIGTVARASVLVQRGYCAVDRFCVLAADALLARHIAAASPRSCSRIMSCMSQLAC